MPDTPIWEGGSSISKATKTRYYFGTYERTVQNNIIQEIDYIVTPAGLTAMRVYNDAEGMEHIYYIHEDNLGSIQAITDENRNLISRYYYTPWGGRELIAGINITVRGYTFHEHLEPFGLINMNGRVYDPVLARFLSPDPYVQAPGFTQSLNRYSYCMNNPFKYTDPDGEFWQFVIAAAIGGVFNLASQMISGNVYDVGDAFKAFGVGALAGLAGAGAGAGVTSAMQIGGFAAGAAIGGAGGAAGGLVSGAGNAWINGASFGEGLVAGVKSAGIGALSGAVLGGITRGITDVKKGFDFWDGGKNHDVLVSNIDLAGGTSNTNNSSIQDPDIMLKDQIQQRFNVKEGDYGIRRITTKPHSSYKLKSDNLFENISTKESVGGYVRRYTTSYHDVVISPAVSNVYMNNAQMFNAVVGHELIHAYHYYTFGAGIIHDASEAVAYKYSSDKLLYGGVFRNRNLQEGVSHLLLFKTYKSNISSAIFIKYLSTPFN